MGLISLFKNKNKNKNSNTLSTHGRALKEISELGLLHTEQESLILAYKLICNIHTINDRLDIINYLKALVLNKPLTPVEDPSETGEFIAHDLSKLQSSRCSSLWSHDGGVTWYDIDNDVMRHHIYRWIYKNIFNSSSNTPSFITFRMLPYVTFPYTKSIE